MLARVREQFRQYSRPKALSHRPDLAGREHLYRQGAGTIVQSLDDYASYARAYEVYAWVHKAVGMVAENLAGLPVGVSDANDKPLPTHPITELFAHVNDEDTPADLWGKYVVNMLLGGEAPYELVPDAVGRPVEIWLRRPDRVAVVPDVTRLAYPTAAGYIFEPEDVPSAPITIEAQWMIFDKFYNPLNPWRGLAPIMAVREGITIDMFAQAWSKGFLKNSTRPDFAIVAPQGITKSERDDYEARFLVKHQGAEHAHLPVVLEQGVTDIKVLSFPPKDIEWLQQREFARDEVGAIFGVPDELMGFGKDTYENFQTALTVFWTLTMQPLIRRRDGTLTQHMRRYGWLKPAERITTDLTSVGVLQEDLTPKVDLARKLWDMGVPWNTLDAALDLRIGPVEGGDVGYLSSSLRTVDQIVNPPEPPPMLSPIGGEGENSPQNDDDDSPPPQQRLYLPDGAKEQAKRALKKLIQGIQNDHLRAARHGAGVDPGWNLDGYDRIELRRWLGDSTDTVIWGLERIVLGIKGDHDAVNAAYTKLKEDAQLSRLLEVAAPAFFTLPKVITPSWVKVMVLRLDREDDEAEQTIRTALDRRTTRSLTQVFNDMLETLYPEGYGEWQDPNLEAQRVRRLFEEEQALYDTLSRALQDGTDLGVSVAVNQLENIGYGFDWTLANTSAREWALRHTGGLVRDISIVTQRGVQQAVARWIDNGEPLESLIQDIEPLFGRKRAERIAVTETTRAYQMGSETAWRDSGVVSQMEWQTVRDEKVCPQCGPMQGQRTLLGGTFNGVPAPPRHVRCRCFTRPVIDESN